MANFLVVVDPDPGRRARYCQVAGPRLAMLEGLVTGECAAGDFAAMWASGPRAPVTSWSDGSGAAVLWGRALADDDGRAIEAAELPALWADVARAMPPAFDGYHAAVSYHPHRGLTVGADILGMYPVFWWSDGTVHLVGSSPELFRHHPRFRWSLDLAGLVGILLTTHSVGGRTLMDSVRRLAPGHLLAAPPQSLPREVRQYDLPVSTDYFDLPYSRALELLHDTLSAAVARHVPSDADSTIALSGGRDSRLLLGMMLKLGRKPVAATFGNIEDTDMRCAKQVAGALQLQHHAYEVPFDSNDVQAKLHTTWLHCTTGLNSIHYWNSHKHLHSLPSLLVTGYAMDPIVGGSHISWALGKGMPPLSFENFFSRINAFGISADTLRTSLRREVFGEVLDEVVDETLKSLNVTYHSYSSFESQKAMCFDLRHRQRLVIGNPPWAMSFGAWPAMPAIDKRVLSVTAGLSAGVLGERRAEEDIIRLWYPALAELPLAWLEHGTKVLSPRLRHLIRDSLLTQVNPWLNRFRRSPGSRAERRYYFRIYDFNSAAWKTARRQAESGRGKLHALFDSSALGRLLPGPEEDAVSIDKLRDTSAMKTLVGLCLWADQYL